MTRNDAARIYVACLACYNEGRLHGVWIDAEQDADAIDAERAAMQATCGHTDNDWAIHDYEGFEGYKLGEFESFANVSKLAALIEEHGPAFAKWLDNGSADLGDADLGERFSDAYRGEWDSLQCYAENLVDDLGYLSDVPDFVARYFDYEAFARDLELGGDVWTCDAEGGVYVFDNNV
jgi:antirestriction protein